jgi:squalene-hopene/tetraprenyl-beta-curcumene cyclase
MYQNYETCIAILCFKEANKDGRYDKTLKNAEKFLKGHQWDEGETIAGKAVDKSNPAYGGAGYGKKARPDLSNTQFFIEALVAAGAGPDDPNLKKALEFVSRCQNLETEHNTTPFAAKVNDGGFYYTPASGGESQAGTLPGGGLRSYASMTYAGLKSMIYCGLKPDDPRVKAASEWISKNYDLKTNPGLGDAGLYYYYHTFAKALEALGQDEFADKDGKKHNWRHELIEELARRQQKDGSWINENNRWLEGEGNLVTAYALLALSHCRPKK